MASLSIENIRAHIYNKTIEKRNTTGHRPERKKKMYQTMTEHKFKRIDKIYIRDDGKYTITKKNDRFYIVKDGSGKEVACFSRLKFAKSFFGTERK